MVSNTNKASDDKNIYEGIRYGHINQINTNSPPANKKDPLDKHLVFTEYYYPKYSDLYTNGDYFDYSDLPLATTYLYFVNIV